MMNPIGFLETGVLQCEDNLRALSRLPDDCVDLIYLDPPFFSNKNYEVIWGDEAEVRSFEDRWEGGIQVYLDWMEARLRHLHRVLKLTGSLYLHCDPNASHYLKVLMDGIFGMSNFRSEVVWKRTSAHSGARRYGPVHDTILFYTRSDQYTWNQRYQPLPQETIDQWYNNFEPKTGRRFNRADLTASGLRSGPSGSAWRGIDPGDRGRHWAIPGFVSEIVAGMGTIDALDALDAAGRIFWPQREGGMPMVKRYIEESRGVPAQDVITYISPLKNKTRERLGYPTQKPEALLDLFINSSTDAGQIVLDPFCGCGTTVAVAQRLRREWIGIDISPQAVEIMKDRLNKLSAQVKVYGLPTNVDELRQLGPHEFQKWVIRRVMASPSARQTGDMGIDGRSFFEQLPIQVKQSERVGRNVVDNFETAVERDGKHKGYIVAFSYTRGAYEEAARARRERGIEIVLVKVEDIVRVGDLIDSADREGRAPDLSTVAPDLMGLFSALQGSAADRPMPPPPPPGANPSANELIQNARKRRTKQQSLPLG